MRGRQWKAFALATVAVVGLSACGGADEAADEPMEDPMGDTAAPEEAAPVDLPEGVTQEQYAEGKQLFTGQGACHACHGPQATGTQLAPDLTDDEWINISGRDYDEIVEVIHTGVAEPVESPGPMPPLGGANLTDEQVEALAAYVVGLGS
ncbi:MAG: c-type cytochrome [Gemmatimonadota bacterium]